MANVYPAISGNTAAFTVEFIKVPADLWNPSCLLADTFTRADGAIGSSESVDSDGVSAPVRAWSGAGATVSGNALCISPTLGEELSLNAGFEGTYASGTAPYFETSRGTPAELTGGDVHSGTSAQKISNPAGDSGYIQNSGSSNGIQLTAGAWVQTSIFGRSIAGEGEFRFRDGANNAIPNNYTTPVIGASWTQYVRNGRILSTGKGYLEMFAKSDASANVNQVGYDDNSVKTITLSSTLALSNIGTADALIMGAASSFTSRTQLGWALGVDDHANPQNGLFCYVDGTYVYLDIMVAGVWTNKVKATPASWVAGVLPIIVRDGTYVAVYYNGSQMGSTVTLSAGENTATRGLYAGGFSTYASNLIADILIKPRGTANEYGSLTAYER